MSPERLGSFLLLGEMARGGTGVIHRARRLEGEGLAAVKVPRSGAPIHRELIRREVAILLRLGRHEHPAIVRVLEADLDGPLPFYAMELIEGPDLADVIARRHAPAGPRPAAAPPPATVVLEGSAPPAGGRRADRCSEPEVAGDGSRAPLAPALEVAAAIARAVAFLHAEGVVHGDLSPRNVILRGGTTPTLIDFGTALSVRSAASAREIAQEEGLVAGTAAYLAPERLRGEGVDARCDLYALGCILFELLAGSPPAPPGARSGGAAAEVARRLPAVPRDIQRLLGRLLEPAPEDRLGRAVEVVVALERALGREPERASLPRPPLHRPRLQGRADDVRMLHARIDDLATDRRGGRVLLSGESGIGKTRLLNEAGRRARARGVEVVVASALDGADGTDAVDVGNVGNVGNVMIEGAGAAAALSLFRPFLRRLADRWAHDAEGEGPAPTEVAEALDLLAAYEPGLRAITGVDPGRPAPLPPTAGRRRVFVGLRRLIEAVSARRPIVFILDDLHLADELSLGFLELLGAPAAGGATAGSAVLLIGAYRSDGSTEVMRRLEGLALDQRLALGRLGLDPIRTVIRDMLGEPDLPEGLPELLHRQSEGNPFYAAEHLHALVDEGVLRWSAEGGWSLGRTLLPADGAGDGPAPAAVARLFLRRLEGLGEPALRLLDLTAVLGREWPGARLQALARAIGQPAAASSGVLEDLLARRILEVAGPDRYRFVHDQLRAVHAHQLPPERRQALHRTLAGLIEEAPGAEPPDPGDIGRHWSLAGAPERAFPHLLEGAARAEAVYASERAVDLYRLAVQQARLFPEDQRAPHLRRACESLGDLLLRLACHEEARQRFTEALTATDPTATPAIAACLHRKLGESYSLVHDFDRAAFHIQQADALLGPLEAQETVEGKREWIAIQHSAVAMRYFARNTGLETLDLIRRLEPAVEAHGSFPQKVAFYQTAGSELMSRNRYVSTVEAVDWARKAVAAVEETNASDEQRSEAYIALGFALLWGDPGQVESSAPWFERAIEAAGKIDDRGVMARPMTYLLIARRRTRDLVRTEKLVDAVQATAEGAKILFYQAVAEACRSWCRLRHEDLDGALAAAARARSLWDSSMPGYPFRWLALFVELAIARERGERSEMAALAAEMLGPQQQRLPPPLETVLQRITDPGESQSPPGLWDQALRLAVQWSYL
jgi:eukaryotic-like serine/threonine-protein kinase